MNTINEVSQYDLIAQLMSRALDHMQASAAAFEEGDGEGWAHGIVNTHKIIDGLRLSLDFENGGQLANNLDSLYEYMIKRLNVAFEDVDTEALIEVYHLLEEIKSGWDGIAEEVESLAA